MSPEPREPATVKPDSGRWWRPFTRSGEAVVFHVDLTPHAGREAEALAWLDGTERARWDRFRHDGRRRQFTLCRAALRIVLCARLGCTNDELSFGESGLGKPHALRSGAPAPVSFSVSHGGGHGLLAVAGEGRVGVDVEERAPRRDLDALIEAVFAPDERAELASASGPHRTRMFYRLWTVKEALVKALGEGVQRDLARFEVPPAMRRGVTAATFRFPHLPAVEWRVENLGNEHFAAAVALERGRESGPAGSDMVACKR